MSLRTHPAAAMPLRLAALVMTAIVLAGAAGRAFAATAAGCDSSPRAGCIVPGSGLVVIKEASAGHERLKLVLKKMATGVGQQQLGDPVTGTTRYDVCLYDGGAALVGALTVDRAAQSCGDADKPCWLRISDKGYRYRDVDGTAAGVQKLVALGGSAGGGKLSVKAGNSAAKQQIAMPTGLTARLEGARQVTVQIVTSDGACFGGTLTRVLRAGATLLAAAGTVTAVTTTTTTVPSSTTTSTTSTTRPTTTTTSTTSTTRVTTTTTTSTTTSLANQAPRANAGPNQATQTLTTLTFNGAGSSDPDGTITAYAWRFGDGATASGVAPTHAYAVAGTYTVTLTVTDNKNATNSDTATALISNRPPTANAGADQTAVAGASVTLGGIGSSDTDGTITSYAWTFGDGTTGTGAVVSHVYAVAGTYTVTLTVTDNAGATGSDTAIVTVTSATAGTWSKAIGAGNYDGGYAVASDGAGNVYAGGSFYGTVTVGSVTLTSAGASDWFVVKYSSAGVVQWARRMGGTADDFLESLAADGNGDVVAAGRFAGTAGFGGTAFVARGASDIVFAKYGGATGAHQWSKQFGGAYDDDAGAVRVDGSGNVYLTGYFKGTITFGGATLQVPFTTDLDVFLAKFTSAGAHTWSKNFTNTGNDRGYGLAVDTQGNIALVGWFSNGINFGGGQLSSSSGLADAFVAKFNPSGTHLWSKRLGSTTGDESAYGVAMDGSGNVVVCGEATNAIDFGGGLLSALGSSDAFVAGYAAASGTHLWSRRLGGSGNDYCYGVAVDATGNVAVAGSFEGTAAFGGTSLTAAGAGDAFAAKYTATGAPVWARQLGGTSSDVGQDVAFAPSGHPVTTGYFYGLGNFGGTTLTSAGLSDAFLARLAP